MVAIDKTELMAKFEAYRRENEEGYVSIPQRLHNIVKRGAGVAVGVGLMIVKNIPDIVNGVVSAVKTGKMFYSQVVMKKKVEELLEYHKNYQDWHYTEFAQDLLNSYKQDMTMLCVNKLLTGGFIVDMDNVRPRSLYLA